MNTNTAARNGLLLMVAGSFIDSTSGLFAKTIGADGFTLTSGRGLFAFFAMMAVLFWRDGRKAPASLLGIGAIGLLVVFFNSIGMMISILAITYGGVANFFMIFATAPFAAAIAARLVLGERIDIATMIAAAAGFAGIAYMMISGARSGALLGNFLAVSCIGTYCILILIIRRRPNIDILPISCFTVIASCLLALPFADYGSVSPMGWLLMVPFGVLQLAGGTLLIFSAIRRIPAAQSGLLGILNAAFAPLWVYGFLGEVPERNVLIGGGIILASATLHIAWTMWQAAPIPRNQNAV